VNVILYFPNRRANPITSLIIVDTESEMVLKEVHRAAKEDPHPKVLLLPGVPTEPLMLCSELPISFYKRPLTRALGEQ
jgi:hypothetical protein